MVYCVVRYGYILMEGNSSFKSELTTTIFCQLCISSSKTLVIQVDPIGIIPQDCFLWRYAFMCAFILCLFFLFFLDNKKTFKHEWVYMSFCTSGCGAFEDFYLSFRLFLSVSIFSLYIPDSTPLVCLLCVCRCDLRLPFPAHLFSGVTVLRQWIGVFLWLLSVQSDTCPPPPGLCSVLLSLGQCGV